MNNFYVYEWIRLDTNEPFYVGKGHGNRAYIPFRNPYFNNIVSKVGIENIAVHILHDNLTEKLAFEYEIYYIYAYIYEFGFNLTNLTIGGDGVSGYKWTEEQRKNYSEANSGELSHMWGKKASEETKRKMSEARKGENNPMYGRENKWGKHSEETRQKMSENHAGFSGENHPRAKAIILIFPDGQQKEFTTIKEASLYLGGTGKGNCYTTVGIKNLLKGIVRKRGRWLGYSAMYKEDIEQEIA